MSDCVRENVEPEKKNKDAREKLKAPGRNMIGNEQIEFLHGNFAQQLKINKEIFKQNNMNLDDYTQICSENVDRRVIDAYIIIKND